MSQADDQQPKLFPSWKQALHDLELAGIEPGQTIEKQWLDQAFGIKAATSIADFERNRMLFRSLIWQLRTNLLQKHRLMLRAVGGVGYRAVEVEDQTAVRKTNSDAVAKVGALISMTRKQLLIDRK